MSEPYYSTGNTELRPCRSCGAAVEHEGARGLYGSPERFRPRKHLAPCGLPCFGGGGSTLEVPGLVVPPGERHLDAYRAGRLHGLGEHRPCPACTGGEPVAVDDPAYLAATEHERVAARAGWERADAERWANYRAMEAAEASVGERMRSHPLLRIEPPKLDAFASLGLLRPRTTYFIDPDPPGIRTHRALSLLTLDDGSPAVGRPADRGAVDSLRYALWVAAGPGASGSRRRRTVRAPVSHGRRSTARERAHAARLRMQAGRRSVRVEYVDRPYGWVPVQATGYVVVDGSARAAWYYRNRGDAELDVWADPAVDWSTRHALPEPDPDWSAERWAGSEGLDDFTVSAAVEVAIRQGLALYAEHVRAGRS